MRGTSILVLFAAVTGLTPVAHAEDARSILEMVEQKQLERWEGVKLYVVERSMMGHRSQIYFQRTEVEDDAGNVRTLFLPTAGGGAAPAGCTGTMRMTAEELEVFAQATDMTAEGGASEIEDGLEEAGLPRGLLAASGSDPTASFDPRVVMGAGADFTRAAAEGERSGAAASAVNAEDTANDMAAFMKSARLLGRESVDGRDALHLQASELNRVQDVDGRQYTLESISIWIDSEEYVPLRMKMGGVLSSGTESKPMTIDRMQTDYRSVPGSKMYEPYRQVMTISGMMDAAQEAELREAQAQMAEFEQELANMPASQRKMMESMMGPQLETMRNMAAGKGFRSEIIVDSIAVNPATTDETGQPCPEASMPSRQATPQPDEERALRAAPALLYSALTGGPAD